MNDADDLAKVIKTEDSVSSRQARWEVMHHVFPGEVQENRDLKRAQQIDTKTGLANGLALERAMAGANKDPNIAVILFDMNNFGKINKSPDGGHDEGDRMLIRAATVLKRIADEHNCGARVFRRGDAADEFVILAPHTEADAILHEVEAEIGSKAYRAPDSDEVHIFSISGAISDKVEPKPEDIPNKFANADAKLQSAKAARKLLDAQESDHTPPES